MPITLQEEDEIVDEYVNLGASLNVIALEHNVSASTIGRILRKRDVVLRAQGPHPTSKYEPEAVIADYIAGMPLWEMAAKYSVDVGTIYKLIREYGVEPRRMARKAKDIAALEVAAEMYYQGVTVWDIYKDTSIWPARLYRWLREHNMPLRYSNPKRLEVDPEVAAAEAELVAEMKLQRAQRKSREDSTDKISGEGK